MFILHTHTPAVGPVIVVDPLSVNVSIEVDNITLNCTARVSPYRLLHGFTMEHSSRQWTPMKSQL